MSRIPAMEAVEPRRLFASAFEVSVQFQPITSRRANNMQIDYGATFAVRRGGMEYGWNRDLTSRTVQRNVASVAKNDRFIALRQGNTWNMTVPNGTYKVYLVAGDPAMTGDRMAITVEGQVAIAGLTKRAKPYLEGGVTVTVTDGNVTVASAGEFRQDKLNYLAIQSISTGEAPVRTTNSIKWVKGARQLVARTEPEAAVVGDKLYVFSGYGNGSATDYSGPGWAPNPTYERYDPATGKWTTLGSMPVATTHAAVSVVGTDVWFAGGYTLRPGTNNRQDVGSTNVSVYHTTTNTWTKGPALPQKRASGGMALVGNKLYFVSGEPIDHTSVTRDVWALDLSKQSAGWASKASIPEGRTHFGIAVVNSKIYVIGGQTGIDANSIYLKTAYSYDPATNAWARLADLPFKRSHLSPNTIALNNQIYSFGGEDVFNHELADVLRYDPATNAFATLSPLPGARAAGAAGYVDGKLLFTGGKNNAFFSDTFIGTFV